MGTTIDDVIKAASDKFGKAIVMRLTDKKGLKVPAQSTGVPQLDLALGVRGLPKGRIIEIFGPESSGKTTLAANIIATAQKKGAWAWYGDMEHALDPVWMEKIGVNLDKMLISQPDNGEECLELAQFMVRQGVIDIVVVDSVSALVPQAELNGEAGDAVVGLQARLMSQAMRKLTPIVSRMDSIGIFINQIREKIGVTWGSPETTSGGRALKFAASVRLDVRRTGSEKKGEDDAIGNYLKIKVVKNKVAPPFKICEAFLSFERGFDFGRNLLDAGLSKGIFEKSGAFFSYDGNRIGHGAAKAAEWINNLDEEKKQELYESVVGKPKVSKSKEEDLPQEYKDKIAKYTKKKEEAETEEEKKKWQDKIDKILSGDVTDEHPNEIGSTEPNTN